MIKDLFLELREGIKKNLEYIKYCKIQVEDNKFLIMKREDKELFKNLIEKYKLSGSLENIIENLYNINNFLKRNPDKGEELGIVEKNNFYYYYNTKNEYRDFSISFLENVKTVTI